MATKFTSGPWSLELIQKWPFGVRVLSGDKTIIHDYAVCHSTEQRTREDCELGVGFRAREKDGSTTIAQAQRAIAEQDANARLIAAAPDLYEAALDFLHGYCKEPSEAFSERMSDLAYRFRMATNKAENPNG